MAAKGSKRGRGKATPSEAEPTTSPEAALPLEPEGPGKAELYGPEREVETVSEPAGPTEPGEPGRPEGPAAWPVSQLVVGGLAVVLVLAALAGVIMYATAGDPARLEQHAQRLNALATETESQASRLDAAEQAVAALQSSLGELQSVAEQNRHNLNQMAKAIEALRSTVNDPPGDTQAGEAVGELRDTLGSLDQRVAGLEQGSNLDDVTGRIARLEEEITGLRDQAAAQAEQATALGRAHATLTAQVAAGAPFAEELEAVAAELPNAPGLEALRPHAGEGVATLADLQARLTEIAGGLPDEQPGEAAAADGVWQTMRQRLEGMVTVRRADEADGPGVLARAEEALQRGDLGAAIAEVERLSEASPELEAWLADARARLDAQAGLDELSDAVLRQFAGRQ